MRYDMHLTREEALFWYAAEMAKLMHELGRYRHQLTAGFYYYTNP